MKVQVGPKSNRRGPSHTKSHFLLSARGFVCLVNLPGSKLAIDCHYGVHGINVAIDWENLSASFCICLPHDDHSSHTECQTRCRSLPQTVPDGAGQSMAQQWHDSGAAYAQLSAESENVESVKKKCRSHSVTAWSWPRTSEVEETVVRPLHLKIVEAC